MSRVAALYVMPDGPYAGLPDVEVWDEARDARLYPGPWPVVAHPPCARWSRLAKWVESMRGIPAGEDGGCFKAALDSVRTWGGVLEHPAQSSAWHTFSLPRPVRGAWVREMGDGWVTEVSQVAYGHRARKRTWLYAVATELPSLDWSEPEAEIRADWMSGMSGERERTPLPFRDLLLNMAFSVSPEHALRREWP